jgi:hypothetical protein
MQLTAKPETVQDSGAGGSSDAAGPTDSDYVGKHRPHRLALRFPRGRASKVAADEPATAAH